LVRRNPGSAGHYGDDNGDHDNTEHRPPLGECDIGPLKGGALPLPDRVPVVRDRLPFPHIHRPTHTDKQTHTAILVRRNPGSAGHYGDDNDDHDNTEHRAPWGV
jgi:hypothetical protein